MIFKNVHHQSNRFLLVSVTGRRRRSDTSVGARQACDEDGVIIREVLLNPIAIINHLIRHTHYPWQYTAIPQSHSISWRSVHLLTNKMAWLAYLYIKSASDQKYNYFTFCYPCRNCVVWLHHEGQDMHTQMLVLLVRLRMNSFQCHYLQNIFDCTTFPRRIYWIHIYGRLSDVSFLLILSCFAIWSDKISHGSNIFGLTNFPDVSSIFFPNYPVFFQCFI